VIVVRILHWAKLLNLCISAFMKRIFSLHHIILSYSDGYLCCTEVKVSRNAVPVQELLQVRRSG